MPSTEGAIKEELPPTEKPSIVEAHPAEEVHKQEQSLPTEGAIKEGELAPTAEAIKEELPPTENAPIVEESKEERPLNTAEDVNPEEEEENEEEEERPNASYLLEKELKTFSKETRVFYNVDTKVKVYCII